ncbi:hypothetical protein GGI43DRAFT_342024 [Trichoderma evansii]
MEPTDLSPDLPAHTIKFELTPIEANGPRRFKHVALVIVLTRTARDPAFRATLSIHQSIHQYILSTFSEAVALWPILGGSITCPDGQLTIQSHTPVVPAMPRDDLIDIQYILGYHNEAETLILQVKNKNLSGIFFPVDGNTLDTGVPPLLLKLTIFDNFLVLGFCFYEAVADNVFIGQFLSSMIDSYWDKPGRVGSYSYRMPLEPFNLTTATRNQFPFYDWSNKPIARLNPGEMLVCQFIEFQESAILGFIQGIRKWYSIRYKNATRTYRTTSLEDVTDKDFFVAILWAAITKARYRLNKLRECRRVMMNILLPGEAHVHRNNDWTYFGSSTVPTPVTVGIQGVVDMPLNSQYDNYSFRPYISDCRLGIRWIAKAAASIRQAIDKVDAGYIRRLMGLKQMLSVEEDTAAYERGLARSTTGTTFEDWTDFYRSGSTSAGIPFTDTSEYIQVLSCTDDLEEGRIILLSQFKTSDNGDCETRLLASLCLELETMRLVRSCLEAEGWIKQTCQPWNGR